MADTSPIKRKNTGFNHIQKIGFINTEIFSIEKELAHEKLKHILTISNIKTEIKKMEDFAYKQYNVSRNTLVLAEIKKIKDVLLEETKIYILKRELENTVLVHRIMCREYNLKLTSLNYNLTIAMDSKLIQENPEYIGEYCNLEQDTSNHETIIIGYAMYHVTE
jgi:hypothetical protein